MSLRTYFIRSEFNMWRHRVHMAWNKLRFSFSMRPLKYRVREFSKKYLFLGVFARWRREKQATAMHNKFRAAITNRKSICPHLKGRWLGSSYLRRFGVKPVGTTHDDYNVSMHRFVNNRARVICNYCKRVWWEGDADWEQALYMVQRSTNRLSSSEIPAAVLLGGFPWQDQPTKSSFLRRTLKLLREKFKLGRTGASKS